MKVFVEANRRRKYVKEIRETDDILTGHNLRTDISEVNEGVLISYRNHGKINFGYCFTNW